METKGLIYLPFTVYGASHETGFGQSWCRKKDIDKLELLGWFETNPNSARND